MSMPKYVCRRWRHALNESKKIGCPVGSSLARVSATRIKPTSTKFWTASILDAPTDIATTSDVIYISGQLLETKRKYGHPALGTKVDYLRTLVQMKERDYNRLASRDSEGILDFN